MWVPPCQLAAYRSTVTVVSEHRNQVEPSYVPSGLSRSRHGDAGIVLLVLAAAFVAARPLSDPDVWWHLRTGELILEEGLVTADPWSFMSSQPWRLHEWLSEVVMYSTFDLTGYSGVVALVSVTIACFTGVLAVSCRRVSEPVVAYTTALLGCVATVPGMGARPQLASWVLLAVAAPYMRSCVEHRRLPWWLLPLTWLWANLHGLWLTALALLAALILGLAVEEGLRGWRTTARFCGFLVAAVSVAAATPVGPRLLLAPFHVRDYAQFVSEWDPPRITNIPTACALLLLLVVVLGWARGRSPVPMTTIGFVVAAAGMGLLYSRTVPVLAIAVAPLAAATLQAFSGPRRSQLQINTRAALVSLGAAVLASAAMTAAAPKAGAPQPGGSLSHTTTGGVRAATEAVQQLPGRARVLNQYELGGWLLWAARDTSPAIDGRADVYSVEHVRAYVEALHMKPGWREFVEAVDADAALLHEDAPLAAGLKLIDWTVHHEQDGLLVLLPPAEGQRVTSAELAPVKDHA